MGNSMLPNMLQPKGICLTLWMHVYQVLCLQVKISRQNLTKHNVLNLDYLVNPHAYMYKKATHKSTFLAIDNKPYLRAYRWHVLSFVLVILFVVCDMQYQKQVFLCFF